jgi:hypothetical protein
VSVVLLIVATRSISGKFIKEMPGSVASGTHCTIGSLYVGIFSVTACGACIYRHVLALHDSRQQRKCIVIKEQRVLEKRIHTLFL